MNARTLFFFSLLAVTVGCAVADDQAPGAAGFAILGGTIDTDHANDAVVAIYDSSGGFCTGTLIAPRAVVMQAFCMRGTAGDLSVLFGPSVMPTPDATIAVEEVVLHPDYDPGVYDSPQVAVAILSADAPAGIMPIPPLPEALALTDADEGSPLQFIGYGPTTRDGSDYGTRRTVAAPIAQVCNDGVECDGRTDLVYVDLATGGGPCTADGPGFIERGGTRYLAGLVYASDMDCTLQGIGSSLGAYQSFLDDVLGADADADADADAETDAGGDADAGADAVEDVAGDVAADGADAVPADGAIDADTGSSGCDCSASGMPGGLWGSALLVGLAALLAGRRRRLP